MVAQLALWWPVQESVWRAPLDSLFLVVRLALATSQARRPLVAIPTAYVWQPILILISAFSTPTIHAALSVVLFECLFPSTIKKKSNKFNNRTLQNHTNQSKHDEWRKCYRCGEKIRIHMNCWWDFLCGYWPIQINCFDFNIQSIKFSRWKYIVPCLSQCEHFFAYIFIHLHHTFANYTEKEIKKMSTK